MKIVDLAEITADSFRPHVGKTFNFIINESQPPVELELFELEEKRFKPSPNSFREPFSIFFRGPAGFYQPQGIKRIEHPEMGRLEIFLVPLQPDEKGSIYQAVFN